MPLRASRKPAERVGTLWWPSVDLDAPRGLSEAMRELEWDHLARSAQMTTAAAVQDADAE